MIGKDVGCHFTRRLFFVGSTSRFGMVNLPALSGW